MFGCPPLAPITHSVAPVAPGFSLQCRVNSGGHLAFFSDMFLILRTFLDRTFKHAKDSGTP